jgi:hypothetical protein
MIISSKVHERLQEVDNDGWTVVSKQILGKSFEVPS